MTDEELSELHKDELLKKASDLEISGRSSMNKDELIAAIEAAERDNLEADAPDLSGVDTSPPPSAIDTHGHTSASLEAAIANANVNERQVTEEQIRAQMPPSDA